MRGGWHVLEPGVPLVWNWHLDVLCGYLEACFRHEIRSRILIINIPPGTMKSLIISVFYPAWVWIHQPGHRFLCGSNDEKLATRDSLRMRDLVASHWYQERWGFVHKNGELLDYVKLSREQNEKGLWANTRRGHRESQGVTAKVTGKRGDTVIWDDPHDAEQTESDDQRQGVLDKWDGSWSSRLNDISDSMRILVMQRVHEADCTAHWLEIYPEAVHLSIPMRYEVDGYHYDPQKDIGRPDLADPRTEEGELLFPEKFPEEAVRSQEIVFGPYRAAGQYQQRPRPKGGGEFKREWLMHWTMPPHGGNRYIIVDPAGERKKTNTGQKRDNTAMVVVEASADQNLYVIDAYRDRLNLVERTRILFEWHRKYRPVGVGYEADGFQSDIPHIQNTQEQINYRFRVTELKSRGQRKEDRIRMLLPWFQQGKLILPRELHRTNFEGQTVDLVQQFIEKEYLPFPVGPFDDMLDVLSRVADPDMQILFPDPGNGPFKGLRTPRMRDKSTGY